MTTHRVHSLCKGLAVHGANVEILLAKPTENANAIRNPIAGCCDGVKYRHVRKSNIRSTMFLKRRWDDFICALLVIVHVFSNRSKCEAVIVIGPSFDFRLLIPLAARCARTVVILEINEYPFVTRTDHLWTSFKRFVLFRMIFPFYDGFIVISEALAEVVTTFKSSKAAVIKIPVLAEQISGNSREDSPLEDPYILHAGGISEEKDGMSGIVAAFASAKSRISFPIKLVITGGAEKQKEYSYISDTILRLGLINDVVFTGYLSTNELRDYFENAALAVINKLDTKQNKYCFPTKLADYTSHGIPIITTTVGEAKYFLKDGENAYIVSPGDNDALANMIVEAFEGPVKRISVGKAGRETFAQAFNRDKQGRRLYDFIRDRICVSS